MFMRGGDHRSWRLLAKSNMRENPASTGAFMSRRGEIFPHLFFTSVVVHPHHGDFASSIKLATEPKHGHTIDFLLTEHRDTEAGLRFLEKAIRPNGVPKTITIDGNDANEAAIKRYNEEHGTTIHIRQVKYFNNIVEQDHRAVKRITRSMLGFKAFDAAQDMLVGIELMHMLKKRQRMMEGGHEGLTAAEPFYSLAA
jgi:hypothetical protein